MCIYTCTYIKYGVDIACREKHVSSVYTLIFLSFVFQSLHCTWHTEGIIEYVLTVAS